MLPNNASVLKKRWPKLYDRLQAADTSTYRITQLDNNAIKVEHKNRAFHPYGQLSPEKTLKHWTSQFTLEDEHCYALGGFGSGFHIQTLIDQSKSNTVFFIGEKDPDFLASLLAQIDCSNLLQNPRIQLAVGPIDQDYFESLTNFPLVNLKTAKPLPYTPLQVSDETYYQQFFAEMGQNYRYLRNLHSVGINDSGFWQATTLKNLPNLINAPDISTTKDLFKDLPLVLISAGPSLDESIDFLKAIQEKALLVCVNTAFRKLFNHGIKPHITVAGDPRYSTYKGYKDCSTEDTFLMAPSYVCPEVAEAFQSRTYTWNTNNELLTYIHSQLGQPKGTEVLEKGTIALSVMDLAKLWGTTRICLVGQDLAISAEGKSHTQDSFYVDEGFKLDLTDCTYYSGNTVDQVPVHPRHEDFFKSFNQVKEDYPSIEFINTSLLGVKIKDIPYKTFDEAQDWIGNHDSTQVRNQLKDSLQKHQSTLNGQEALTAALTPLVQFSQKLLNRALEAIIQIESLPDKMDQASYANNPHVKACHNSIIQVIEHFNKYPKEHTVLLDGHTKREIYNYMKVTHKIEAKTPHWHELMSKKEYCWALAKGAEFLLRLCKKSLQP